MRKNKISDILFGLLLLGFFFPILNGCGKVKSPAPSIVQQIETNHVTDESDMEVLETKTKPKTEAKTKSKAEPKTEAKTKNKTEAKTKSKTEANTKTGVHKKSIDMSSLKSVKSVCGLVAPVEKNTMRGIEACHWNSYGEHPYDVVYDFGKEYQKYVDACDWSLVFDAEYYMNEFPMLALQYHYDKKELLFHFQTIGIHEGRQGSKDFNVYAYAMNSDQSVEDTFGSNYEGYYLYYMLNYDTEKNINTVTTEDMANVRSMYDFRPTALQHGEMDAVCTTRNNAGVDDVVMYTELCAFANYRAYLNAHDGYKAHDWAKENLDLFTDYYHQLGGTCAAENTVTWSCDDKLGKITELSYRRSKDHYNAMVRECYHYIGVSNVCNGDDSSSQFDYFIDNIK